MPPHEIALEQNEYRLVLVKSGSNALWAENVGEVFRLPRVTIPRWTRPAEQLQQAIELLWSIRSIILDFLPGKKDSAPCAVVEILSSESPIGLAMVNIDDITEEEMTSDERDLVKAILAGNTLLSGPFSRMGWIQEAMRWLRSEVGHGIAFTGDIRQYNASASFALVRFGTQAAPAYWLKATGKPNEREFTITATLSKYFPSYLPPLVAAREDWNAWVTEDAGQPLRDSFTLPVLEQATVALAELQIQSTEHVEKLLVAGCFDQKLTILKADVCELIAYLEEAMEHQSSTRVPRLEKRRLHEIGRILEDACARVLDIQIPDALIHNDINSSNVLFDGTRCVFTDWAEGYIGNPFLTYQQIFEQALRDERTRGGCLRLQALYAQQWRAILTESQIQSIFSLAPLLAIASYLYGRGTWLSSSRRADSHFQSYSRSLARYMDRAARAPELLEALCQ